MAFTDGLRVKWQRPPTSSVARREHNSRCGPAIEVFGLHQDRAQARHRFAIRASWLPDSPSQNAPASSAIADEIGAGLRSIPCGSRQKPSPTLPAFWRKYDDVQFGFKRGTNVHPHVLWDSGQCCCLPRSRLRCKFAAPFPAQQSLRRHNAAAAAPAGTLQLISPRCSSAELK